MSNLTVDHSICTYGKTKCAVILHDMVKTFDSIFPGSQAKKAVGKAFAEVLELRAMVCCEFITSKDLNRPASFKEHHVWNIIYKHISNMRLYLPEEMSKMLRAVCKEQINLDKSSALGIESTHPVFTVQELAAWCLEDRVVAARKRYTEALNKKVCYNVWN